MSTRCIQNFTTGQDYICLWVGVGWGKSTYSHPPKKKQKQNKQNKQNTECMYYILNVQVLLQNAKFKYFILVRKKFLDFFEIICL